MAGFAGVRITRKLVYPCGKIKKGNRQRGVYPRLLWPHGGIGKTRPREAPPRAPNCAKFSSDALAKCPQPLPSTHIFFFSSTLRLTRPRRTRGLRDPPWRPHVGGVCPRKTTKFMYYPRVTIISPHLNEIIPLHDHS